MRCEGANVLSIEIQVLCEGAGAQGLSLGERRGSNERIERLGGATCQRSRTAAPGSFFAVPLKRHLLCVTACGNVRRSSGPQPTIDTVHQFRAELQIVDGNPFVELPSPILDRLFGEAGRDKSPIPVRGSINGKPFRQTLVKFRSVWRLYVNMQMLDDSPRRIGESIEVEVEFDPDERTIAQHPRFADALAANADAKDAFERLPPSRQKEILRYIASLKTEASVKRNVERAINHLLGEDRFVGRDGS